MSDSAETSTRARAVRRPPGAGVLMTVGGVALLLGLPFVLPPLWLQTGLFAMAAAIGAIGLTLLTGSAGQLSLGHSFFLAVGAYGYVWAAGDTADSTIGLALPGPIAAILAVALAGVAGGLFSPISGRLRGMYLGVATLALVFIGHHVMLNLDSVTGGFNGRSVPPLEIGGFGFTSDDPAGLLVLGHPFGALERLWYLGVVLVLLAWITARNLLRGRPGRALGAVRDSEIAASTMGVSVARYRSGAFVVSSMYAGLAGVLIALVFRRVVPDYFGFALSLDYLAMIVIGGLGSVGGAVLGAVFVTTLPQLLTQYADRLPLVVSPGSTEPGVTPAELSRYLYGLAIVLVLLFTRQGLIGLFHRLRPAPRTTPPDDVPAGPDGPPNGDLGPGGSTDPTLRTATAKEPTT